jgi:hypothetical protein
VILAVSDALNYVVSTNAIDEHLKELILKIGAASAQIALTADTELKQVFEAICFLGEREDAALTGIPIPLPLSRIFIDAATI